MRARLPAQVLLLAVASSLWGCGPGPTQANGAWHTADYLPPSSGLAGYQNAQGDKPPMIVDPPPDHPVGKPNGNPPGWGNGGGNANWNGNTGWNGAGWGGGAPWGGGPYGYGGGYGYYGSPLPFPSMPYVPPIFAWGAFSPIPLFDIPGPPVGPVTGLFGGLGGPWGW